MVVNGDTGCLNTRVDWTFFASKLCSYMQLSAICFCVSPMRS
ncbi:hypothetical protein PMI35_01097 [Pseudomonas sp. GM78]|nr:hypothetical protein PMI35_01097 [Pseudomonas sp. GM78]